MNILLTERINDSNQYIELLGHAYKKQGHYVIFGVQNFLYSDFLPDFIHIHWPEAIYRWRHRLPVNQASINLIESRLAYFKQHGIPIVYTAHNLAPHKHVTDFDKTVYTLITASADIIVHHGHASVDLLKQTVPESKNSRHIVCPHGPYNYTYADPIQARKTYHIPPDKLVILNFGRQRKSKGPQFISEVFKKVKGTTKQVFLFTIGPNPPASKKEKGMQLLSHQLQLAFPGIFKKANNFRDVGHHEISSIFAASDICFLGHQTGLNSGLIAHAISNKKPLVYPDLGNFAEQAEGWPWAEKYKTGDISSAVHAVEKIAAKLESSAADTPPDNTQWLEQNSWEKSVSLILAEIEKLTK